MNRFKQLYRKYGRLYKIYIRRDIRAINAQKWFKINGDSTLRIDYDLDQDSIVFDVGGYKGEWTAKIYEKYNCKVHVFEPITEFYTLIVDKFFENKEVVVNNYGLYSESKEMKISLLDNGSSIFKESDNSKTIRLIELREYLDHKNIMQIDLIKLNIEGAEYDLIDHMFKYNLINKMRNIQIQFHLNVENANQRRNNIQKKLSKTHVKTYEFPFIWENWKLKE